MNKLINFKLYDIPLNSGEFVDLSPKQVFINIFHEDDEIVGNDEICPQVIRSLAIFLTLTEKYKLTAEDAISIMINIMELTEESEYEDEFPRLH